MNRWVIALNISLFVLVALAIYFYQLHHHRFSTRECLETHLQFANLKLARDEITKACQTLAAETQNTTDRAVALCILRDTPQMITAKTSDLATYLEPCYTAHLRK
jgi:hypothetical protein